MRTTARLSSARRTLRNGRLLAASLLQHLIDDPALLALQISRKLPLTMRTGAGHVLVTVGEHVPGGSSTAALGASMAGDESRAEGLLERSSPSRGRLHGEIAVLLDRQDLLTADSPAPTRARAAWMRGDFTEALEILERAGLSGTSQARRLASEKRLLGEGYRLRAPAPCGLTREASPDEPLRVLHLITNSLPHTQSGYSLRTHHILTSLRGHGIDSLALTRTGYPVMVGKPWCAEEDVVDGIRYRRTLPARLGETQEERLHQEVEEALHLVSEFRPDVLHATTDYRNALVAQAVSASTGIPWLFEVRGLMEQTWIASRRSGLTRDAAERSEKVRRIIATESSLAREADGVVTLSRTMADVLVERGVPREGISLIPNGVNSSLLNWGLAPAEARSRLGDPLTADELAVGAVSALVDYEGHDVLLRAVALLLSREDVPQHLRDRLRVVIVGDGVTAPLLAELAQTLGIADRLLLPGRAPRQEAPLWVQALDVVVVPRKDFEVTRTVTPQKPAEALSLSRPVVASDLPAMRETLAADDGGELGVLVPPESPEELADALAELLLDDGRRQAIAARGRAAAERRTWPAMIERYEFAYRALVHQSSEESHSAE